MQEEKEEIYAPIKRRVHIWLKHKGITHDVFFQSMDIATSAFKGRAKQSEFGGEVLAKIVALYPTISTRWLLTGEGSMERNLNVGNIQIQNKVLGSNNLVAQGTTSISKNIVNPDNYALKDELISELRSHVEYLKGEIKRKDEIISQLLSVKLTPQNEE